MKRMAGSVAAWLLIAACNFVTTTSSAPVPFEGGAVRPVSPYCPPVSTLAACAPAPGSDCTPAVACGLEALPSGLACSGSRACSLAVDPCPDRQKYVGGERVDVYVCTCVSGLWSCDDCNVGTSLCAESPDGAPYFAPLAPLAPPADAAPEGEASVENTDASTD